jgi:hypothetical protein
MNADTKSRRTDEPPPTITKEELQLRIDEAIESFRYHIKMILDRMDWDRR